MKLPLSPSPALAKSLAALALLAAIAFIIYSALPAGASSHWTDYDTDDDGLIDITTIAQLQGIRFDHDGNGWIRPQNRGADLAPYNAAFPNRQTSTVDTLEATTTRMGCPAACIGYELMNNLDFANATTTQRNWTTGYAYAGIFEGNGYTISNLVLNAGNAVGGLFSTLDSGGVIRNLGIVNPTVAGQGSVSGLAAINRGAIIASYVSGGTITSGGNVANVGGLVGLNEGSIIASYATATSTRTTAIPSSGAHRSGGLVGRNSNTAKIIASWSAGNVSHSAGALGTVQVGGLVGVAQGASSTITHSYCDTTVQATTTPCLGGRIGGATPNTVVAASYTTAQLQTPTAYTGIYANWNVDLSTTTTYPDAFPDNPWRFGTSTTYPRTKNAAELLAPPDDYDQNDNNLIDINNLHQLNAIRHDLNGDGLPNDADDYSAYAGAFPNGAFVTTTPAAARMGCPQTCTGYELAQPLDFDTDGDGQVGGTTTSTDPYTNFAPIGGDYTAIFNGNGHTITRLPIASPNVHVGLFGILRGTIRDVGMIAPNVSGGGENGGIGALAGEINGGAIITSYARGAGRVRGTSDGINAGGLAGLNRGVIRSSYSTIPVSSTNDYASTGGLAGQISRGTITNSYAAGAVSVSGDLNLIQRGGLIGQAAYAQSRINNSYCDAEATGQNACVGNQTLSANVAAATTTTAGLQTPTAYTRIYRLWNTSVDADAFPDNPWNFGATTTYPTLKTPAQRQAVEDYDTDGDNLIEINNLHQLNAIRYDLNGDGLPAAAGNYPAYAGAFPGGDLATTTPAAPRMGCPQTCTGYELAQNLNFDTDGDGQVGVTTTSTDPYPIWTPIGTYTATFDGNGNTISHLTITGGTGNYGLFSALSSDGVIRDVGMVDAALSGGGIAGALVGQNDGTVATSYAQGGSVATNLMRLGYVGGLVGYNQGADAIIRASWSTASVTSHTNMENGAGGLVGVNQGATITAGFGAGLAAGYRPASLVSWVDGGTVTGACDLTINTTSTCIGELTQNPTTNAPGATTAQLQALTGYTGVFANFNIDIDGDTFPDNPWLFDTATTTYPTLKTPAQRRADPVADYDEDNDNLIDINTLEQLNAIRHDLNGDGLPTNLPAYAGAFPNGAFVTTTPNAARMGCPQTCAGYELAQNLNFDRDGDGQVGVTTTSTDPYPNWNAIGGSYAATFDGNGNTISNLTLNFTAATGNAGLFDTLGSGGVLRDVGMITPNLRSSGTYLGALVGQIDSGAEVRSSYVRGGVLTATGGLIMGGLAGGNSGTIQAAYATAEVTGGAIGNVGAGGLAGASSGVITASYAAGPVSGTGSATVIGGFVGTLIGAAVAINDGYCDTTLPAAAASCIGTRAPGVPASVTAQGATTAQLQTPTGYTGPYANFNLDLNGDTFPDYLWNFGTTTTYPTLYTPSERQTAAAVVMDYDQDDDNLIDITNPHQLNALRYDPDGNGLPDNPAHYSAYTGGFPNGNISDTSTPYLGCAATCIGYELTQNLDFAADEMAVTSTDDYPNWTPIPSYQSTLDGKGHTITRLTINGSHANAGLFAALTTSTVIRDLGILAPNVTSAAPNANAGALVGNNAGLITASYIDGGSVTVTVTGATSTAGGLAGQNTGDIRAAYSTAAVTASTTATSTAGGLIGLHTGGLTASYAAGPVTGAGSAVGGLIGQIDTAGVTIINSYCDITATTQSGCIGDRTPAAPATVAAPGKTTSELQTPTDYTGIYEAWAITLTPGDNTRYNVWNFGAATEYPTLYQPADRQITITDTLPPPLPRTIPPEPEKPYDPAADHPEIYENTEYEMAATCQTHNPDENGNPQSATITFDLGTYTGPILLHLSIFTNQRYMAYETQDLALPTLDRNGQTAKIRVETNPAQTRFRLDGRRNGLAANLLLGYANCQTNDP